MLHSVYLINRMPTKVLSSNSPYFLVHGSLPTYSTLRVFCCVCYVHLVSREHNKLSPKSVKCMYLGFGDTQKGFRYYDPISRRVRYHDMLCFLNTLLFILCLHLLHTHCILQSSLYFPRFLLLRVLSLILCRSTHDDHGQLHPLSLPL